MKFNIYIVNQGSCPCAFDADRTTILGNPHVMKDGSDKERNRVCDAYEEDVNRNGFNEAQLKYLRRIWKSGVRNGFVKLRCWCAPRRCHCETIAAWLESHMTNESNDQ